MKQALIFIFIVVVSMSFCSMNKSKPSAKIELNAAMSDKEILHALYLESEVLQSERTQGKDGYSMTYSDDTNEIHITRSKVSGVIVWRSKPIDIEQTWKLGVPK